MEIRLREVERENKFLKKFQRILRQKATVEDFYRLVRQEENAGEKSAFMCRKLGVPRPPYYRWQGARGTPTIIRHRELTEQVKTVFDASDGIFGHPMVHAKLTTAGVQVSLGTVAAIMAENGWGAKRMRAFKRTTIPSDPDKVFADLINTDFTSETPGTRLVGDITYLRTNEGWLYLATVIGLLPARLTARRVEPDTPLVPQSRSVPSCS